MFRNYRIAKPVLVWLLVLCLVPLGFSFDASGGNAAYAASEISRGEFISEIAGFFGWPHWDEYNDIWKDDPKTFDDISGSAYQRAIETALEEGVVGPKGYVGKRSGGDGKPEWGTDVVGSFKPNDPVAREDAAVMLARAYKLDTSSTAHGYADNDAFSSDEARGSVTALAKLGLLGAVAGNFNPTAAFERDEALALLAAMKDGVAAPVYFIPRPTTGYAPRRNIKLYTANPAAEIYVARSAMARMTPANNGVDEPANPVQTLAARYSEYHTGTNPDPRGYLGYAIDNSTSDRIYPVIKAIAVDPGKTLKTESEVARGDWKIWRPSVFAFDHELVFAKGELGPGSPAVYRLFNRSDSVLAMAWYIEGSDRAIVFDALSLSRAATVDNGVVNLRDYVLNNLASAYIKADPYNNLDFVLGHDNPDHVAQMWAFDGHNVYVTADVSASQINNHITQHKDRVLIIEDRDVLYLGAGDTEPINVYKLPGHSVCVILQDKAHGLIFATDIYGCTRAGSVDDVAVSGVRTDLMLSFAQQTRSKYFSGGGKAEYIFTGHDEAALSDVNLLIYEEAFQLVIDEGLGVTHPTYRNLRNGPNGRTVTIGSTYPDSPSGLMPTPIENSFVPTPGNATPTLEIPKYRRYRGATEWISITFGGPSFGTTTAPNYLSSPQSWNNVKENYNTGNANGAVTYSQLSNIEFSGAELAGVDIQWGSAATSVLPNSFDPWTYDYTVKVQPGTESITVVPTSMSTKVKSIKLNGSEVAYRSSNAVVVEDGKAFTIDVTAPDGATESHYTFTMSVAVDLATVPAPAADNSESNQLPLTGYFKASLPAPNAGREIRYYIPDTAIQRPYFHFIAVPNGVNADNFIVASGWKQIADETGECLFVLMPKDGVWGTVADEKAYIAAARAYHQGGGANFFTTFGLYYLTGYKEGAAPLEAWAADNTNLVIAQSYVGSAGASTAALNAAGATSFGWMQMTDGDQRTDDRFVIENGVRVKQKILSQMTARLASFLNPGITGYEGLLTKGDMPVPTWLVNASNGDSLTYWKKVNKATGAAADSTITSFGGVAVTAGDVFAQKEDAWPTEYAGQISKVTSISASADTGTYAFSKALRDAMAKYTRYDSSITYGNALTYRLDYTAVQVERFSSKDKYATGKVSGLTLDGQNVEAEVTLSLFKTARGVADALLYVPETAGGKDIPVVIVNHGGSQNAHLYLDSTAWWQTAAKEGFALVLTTRTTQGTGGIAPDNLTLFDATINYLKADGRFDMTRIYTTGQSAGGTLTVTYAQDRADQLAAAYSTASGTPNSEFGGKAIPVGHAAGEGNYANRAIPGYAADTSYPSDETTGLVRSTAAAAAGADIYWDNAVATPGRTTGIHRWMAYFTDANGLGANALSSTVRYHGASTLNGGINNPDGRLADWQNNNARFRSFNWKNDYGIPVMEYTLSLFEAHNDLQGFRPFIWDFMKHYRVVENGDGTVTRYYSESAFADDDAVIIFPDILRFSVGAAAESDIARDVEFTLSASNAKNLLSVEVEFVVDGDMLAGKGIEPMNGFTLIDDVFWSYAGGSQWKGTATLAFPAGSSEGLMSAASVDIAKFVFAARAAGDATLQLTSVRAAGLVEPVTQYLDAIIEQGTATTNIDQRVFSKYDLNRDNKVDALDLGIMLLYCGFDKDSPNWDTLVKVNDSKGKGVTASMCDVNSDGVIDMLDLLDLFIHYTK